VATGRLSASQIAAGGDDQMRHLLATVPFRGVVVFAEGENDESPMPHNGEEVGSGVGPEYDVAVDRVDGITLLAKECPTRSP
jgi:fructose-1,6-bisphosphatase II